MSAPLQTRRGRLWSLWDMLNINANAFLGAATQLSRLHALTSGTTHGAEILEPGTVTVVGTCLRTFMVEADNVGARLAAMHATRLFAAINENPVTVTISELSQRVWEIESRFSDHLTSINLFVLTEADSQYLQIGDDLLGAAICRRFPSVIFEMEEAAKCAAFGRPTASAFHSMRVVEASLKGLRAFLGVPEPEKPAERNWAIVLGAIKEKMDAKYPARSRKANSEGAKVEAIYATLDAVKNPWRNATMHAEQVYQPHEAIHILNCVHFFLEKLSEVCNEDGVAISEQEEDE